MSIIACNQTWQAATDWVDRRREDCMGYKLGLLRGELKPHRSFRTHSNIDTLFHVNCEFAWTTLHTYTQKTSFWSITCLPFVPSYIRQRSQHLPKAYGIKVRCYGEHVGEHIENLMGTHWELKGKHKWKNYILPLAAWKWIECLECLPFVHYVSL